MGRKVIASSDDGQNAYTLERDVEANNATLKVQGVLTVKLARELVEDLAPLAGARAARAARGTLGVPKKDAAPAAPQAGPNAREGAA